MSWCGTSRRSTINQRHPLVSVVVIAVLAGADGPTAIARWAALKEELLLDALDLPHGVPGRDVFLRVLGASASGTLFEAMLTFFGVADLTQTAFASRVRVSHVPGRGGRTKGTFFELASNG